MNPGEDARNVREEHFYKKRREIYSRGLTEAGGPSGYIVWSRRYIEGDSGGVRSLRGKAARYVIPVNVGE